MKNTFLLLITLLIVSCSTDEIEQQFIPTLPKITQTGANTFGCYVDGTVFVPRDGEGTFNSPSHGIIYHAAGTGPNYLFHEVEANNYKDGSKLLIHIVGLYQNGSGNFNIENSNCQFSLDANPTTNVAYFYKDEQTSDYKYYCSIENTGMLTITKHDIPNRIISGTFSCTLVNKDDSNDTLEITEGRFDFHWTTINETTFP